MEGFCHLRYPRCGGFMDTKSIIAYVDAEIVKLKKARTILSGVTGTERLAAVVDCGEAFVPAPSKSGRRKMTAAGKAKIAKAQKARWAAVRKAAKKSVQA
jgi:hypothetical protein